MRRNTFLILLVALVLWSIAAAKIMTKVVVHWDDGSTDTVLAPLPATSQPSPSTQASVEPSPVPSPSTLSASFTPTIELSDVSIPAGHAMHFNALASKLPAGHWQTARSYQWDFGDAGSKHNQIEFPWAAHVYSQPGTYTVTLTVTDEAGAVGRATAKVNVTAPGRQLVELTPETYAAKSAILASASNAEAVLSPGVYVLPTAVKISGSNVVLRASGPGVIIRGPSNGWLISPQPSARNVTIRGFAFENASNGVTPRGRNISVIDCSFRKMFISGNGHAINGNSTTTRYLLVQGCDFMPDLSGYGLYNCGKDTVVLGCTFRAEGFLTMHQNRGANYQRWAILYCDFDAPTSRASAFFMQGMTYGFAHNSVRMGKNTNGARGGGVGASPLAGADGLKDPNHSRLRTLDGLIRDNVFDGPDDRISVGHGTHDLHLRNNVRPDGTPFPVKVHGWSDEFQRGNEDIWVNGRKAA